MNKILILLISVFLIFILIRYVSPSQLDDLTLDIECGQNLIDRSKILFVIPLFNNVPISENKTWCNYILSLNKTLGLHGVYHTYKEFNTERDQAYLDKGIDEFYKCFGFKPVLFKPPQLSILKQNKLLIKKNNLILYSMKEQLFSKVYHCNNTGSFSNNFIRIF